ncbi:hypothetical protein BN1708_003486 [Verticillium longisporum]|uniref:Uncharacterized protein n=1 Tax=Verticillium longisporum TaxID=100787 RepID=A0A0G4LIN7_VERLO|nr:hypothetical protein BN1708_003486 [Verticillium longisporum]
MSGANLVRLPAIRARGEAELIKNLNDLLATLGGDLRVLGHKLENTDLGILALVVLDVTCTENILGREALKLAVGNATHESGLAGTVATAKTVAVTLEETKVGVGKQKHATIGKRKVGVDDLSLAVILPFRDTKFASVLLDVVLLHSVGNGGAGFGEGLEVGRDARGYTVNVASTILLNLGIDDLVDIGGGDALDNILVALHGLLDDVESPLGKLTNLRERGTVVDALDTRLELGQEGAGLDRVVDELGQVLHDNNGLSENLLRGGGGVEGSLEKGRQEGQNGGGDDGNKGSLRKGVDRLAEGVDGGVLHGVDEERNSGGNVVVRQEVGERVHRLNSLLADLSLEVVHASLDNGNEASELGAEGVAQDIAFGSLLLGRANDQLGLVGHLLEELVGADGALPLAGRLAQVRGEGREKADDESLGAQVGKQSIEAILRRVPHDSALVSESVEGNVDNAAIPEEENGLAGRLLGREALKECTQEVLGALATKAALLVGSSLLDLSEDAVPVSYEKVLVAVYGRPYRNWRNTLKFSAVAM